MKDHRRKLLKNIGIHRAEEEISEDLWNHISIIKPNDAFIHEFHDKLDWTMISRVHTLPDETILKYKHLIEWDYYFAKNEVKFAIMKQFILKTKFRTRYEFQSSQLSAIEKQENERILDIKYLFKK